MWPARHPPLQSTAAISARYVTSRKDCVDGHNLFDRACLGETVEGSLTSHDESRQVVAGHALDMDDPPVRQEGTRLPGASSSRPSCSGCHD